MPSGRRHQEAAHHEAAARRQEIDAMPALAEGAEHLKFPLRRPPFAHTEVCPPGPATLAPYTRRQERAGAALRLLGTRRRSRGCRALAVTRSSLADAGEDEGDVVLAALAQCLGDRLAGAVQRGAWPGQGGAERVAQRGDAVVERPGAVL